MTMQPAKTHLTVEVSEAIFIPPDGPHRLILRVGDRAYIYDRNQMLDIVTEKEKPQRKDNA